MSTVTQKAFEIPNYQRIGSAAYLRYTAETDFYDSDGNPIFAENETGQDFFLEIPCTVAGDTVTVDDHSVTTTTDSIDKPQAARVTLSLFDAKRQFVRTIYQSWEIPTSLGSEIEFKDLVTHNNAVPNPYLDSNMVYTREQINRLLEDVVVGPSSGEANTASNLGTGANLFKQKSGVDLQFRSVTAASNKVQIAQNADDVSIDVNQTNLSLTKSQILDLDLSLYQLLSAKNQANGYAGLDGSGLIPSAILPSFVDDVVEYANFAALPGTGETGKIYVTLDNNKTYRWSGSAYVEISASPGSTDSVTEGATNLYFTNARARLAISLTTTGTSGAATYNSSTGVLNIPQYSGGGGGSPGGSDGQVQFNNAGAFGGSSSLTWNGSTFGLGGQFSSSFNSAASVPAAIYSGTWFTGGTATTNKPHLLIEPTGTTSTGWSTSGTGLGVNAASGFGGNLIDLQVAGSSKLNITAAGSISSQGSITAGQNISLGSTNLLTFLSRLRISTGADGNALLQNNAQTSFGLLQFGGTTSSFPAIKRNGTGLDVRLADDSGYTTLTGRFIAPAHTTSAGTAPIKLTSGTAMTTPEDGALEYHSSHLYFTIGSTRYQLDQQSGGGGAVSPLTLTANNASEVPLTLKLYATSPTGNFLNFKTNGGTILTSINVDGLFESSESTSNIHYGAIGTKTGMQIREAQSAGGKLAFYCHYYPILYIDRGSYSGGADAVKTTKDGQFQFSNDTVATATADTGISRVSAGVAKITNGSTGFGNLQVGTLYLNDGSVKQVTYGANDSGGAGYKVLRIAN